jgi:uncharacterized membrane protein
MRFLIISVFLSLLAFSFIGKDQESTLTVYQNSADSLKTAALIVLENNCNECHSKKEPAYYFTAKTMDYFVAKINIEVFVTGKMPKGRKNELTTEDRETLRLWVEMKLKK